MVNSVVTKVVLNGTLYYLNYQIKERNAPFSSIIGLQVLSSFVVVFQGIWIEHFDKIIKTSGYCELKAHNFIKLKLLG